MLTGNDTFHKQRLLMMETEVFMFQNEGSHLAGAKLLYGLIDDEDVLVFALTEILRFISF